jgi:hypothetical protein
MDDDGPSGNGHAGPFDGDAPGPRDPRPPWFHWMADTLVAFLVIVPFFLTDLSRGVLVAAIVGLALTPLTVLLERRHLADRDEEG